MCYAAYKLWNACNYERLHYKELGLAEYPDWYYQKKAHKDDLWARQLPSQTAQEVCKLLDKSWKSFYELNRSHGIANPRPPRFKHDCIAITYMQKAIVHEPGSAIVRLTLSKHLKMYMSESYDINDKFLFLENKIFESVDNIKQIKIYPPSNGECRTIVIYETDDVVPKPDNGNYLSIDLGIHNLMTCYNSRTGETFIAGRKYLSLCHYYNKEIARVQSQWSSQQYNNGVNTVVIGDITNIRKNKDFGNVTNQKLHALPYKKIYTMLDYKLAQEGITLVKQKENYSSQTSPLMPCVDKINADKHNRVKRGLYRDGLYSWNADCVGAYNILRLFLAKQKIDVRLDPKSIKEPFISKVAA